jgi:hypothetical protein
MSATYTWRRLDLEGLVFVRLDDGAGRVSVEGYEICIEGDDRWAARFATELDAGWRH